MTEKVNHSLDGEEEFAQCILNSIDSIKKWLIGLTVVIFLSMAVITTNTVVTRRTGQEGKKISAQNNRFLVNFSNYLRCLVVNEEEVVLAMGKDAYLDLCDSLLFLGTDQKPNVIKAKIPENFVPSTTTTIVPPSDPTTTPPG